MCFFCLFSVCICVCFYLINFLFPSLSLWSISSPHLFMCLRLKILPFLLPCVCLSLLPPQKKLRPCSPRVLSLYSLFLALSKFVQRRAQFDSVSLVIQGSMEGELNLMDNLSGSICHYYALPPKSSKHSTDKKVNNHQNDDSLPSCHTSSGSRSPPTCRAAQVIVRTHKPQAQSCSVVSHKLVKTFFFFFWIKWESPLKGHFTQITQKLAVEPASLCTSILDLCPNPHKDWSSFGNVCIVLSWGKFASGVSSTNTMSVPFMGEPESVLFGTEKLLLLY